MHHSLAQGLKRAMLATQTSAASLGKRGRSGGSASAPRKDPRAPRCSLASRLASRLNALLFVGADAAETHETGALACGEAGGAKEDQLNYLDSSDSALFVDHGQAADRVVGVDAGGEQNAVCAFQGWHLSLVLKFEGRSNNAVAVSDFPVNTAVRYS